MALKTPQRGIDFAMILTSAALAGGLIRVLINAPEILTQPGAYEQEALSKHRIGFEHRVRLHLHCQNYQDRPHITDGNINFEGDRLDLRLWRRLQLLAAVLGSAHFVTGQDLAPRAYVITPVHSNAVTLTWAFYDGGVNFSGSVPVTATGTYHVPIFSYYHSLSFFGRSANISAALPYGVGSFEAAALGKQRSAYRSGLLDLSVRLSVNLKGGPAMEVEQFSKWKQKTILGASLRVIAPTGQYSPTRLINWGINRWAFKPEFGCSERWGHWVLDGYSGVWFYTKNSADFHIPRPAPQTEEPIGSLESHLSRDFGRGTWVSLDGNFWWGGVTTLNGIRNPQTRQTSSRAGVTAAFRFAKHQSIKVSYSNGTYIRYGGNWQNVSVAWQYSWLGRPF